MLERTDFRRRPGGRGEDGSERSRSTARRLARLPLRRVGRRRPRVVVARRRRRRRRPRRVEPSGSRRRGDRAEAPARLRRRVVDERRPARRHHDGRGGRGRRVVDADPPHELRQVRLDVVEVARGFLRRRRRPGVVEFRPRSASRRFYKSSFVCACVPDVGGTASVNFSPARAGPRGLWPLFTSRLKSTRFRRSAGSAGGNLEARLVDWDRLDVLITSSRRRVRRAGVFARGKPRSDENCLGYRKDA